MDIINVRIINISPTIINETFISVIDKINDPTPVIIVLKMLSDTPLAEYMQVNIFSLVKLFKYFFESICDVPFIDPIIRISITIKAILSPNGIENKAMIPQKIKQNENVLNMFVIDLFLNLLLKSVAFNENMAFDIS